MVYNRHFCPWSWDGQRVISFSFGPPSTHERFYPGAALGVWISAGISGAHINPAVRVLPLVDRGNLTMRETDHSWISFLEKVLMEKSAQSVKLLIYSCRIFYFLPHCNSLHSRSSCWRFCWGCFDLWPISPAHQYLRRQSYQTYDRNSQPFCCIPGE